MQWWRSLWDVLLPVECVHCVVVLSNVWCRIVERGHKQLLHSTKNALECHRCTTIHSTIYYNCQTYRTYDVYISCQTYRTYDVHISMSVRNEIVSCEVDSHSLSSCQVRNMMSWECLVLCLLANSLTWLQALYCTAVSVLTNSNNTDSNTVAEWYKYIYI